MLGLVEQCMSNEELAAVLTRLLRAVTTEADVDDAYPYLIFGSSPAQPESFALSGKGVLQELHDVVAALWQSHRDIGAHVSRTTIEKRVTDLLLQCYRAGTTVTVDNARELT